MKIQKVLLTGDSHLIKNINCQSFVDYATIDDIYIGVVADGCGSGKHNEVAAKISVSFLMTFLKTVFESKRVNYELFIHNKTAFAQILMERYLEFLAEILIANTKYVLKNDNYSKLDFITNYLLTTLSIVIVYKNQAVVYAYSDGFNVVDEEVVSLKIVGKRYIAQYLETDIVPEFQTFIYENIKQLIVADDGLRYLFDRQWFYKFDDDGLFAQTEFEINRSQVNTRTDIVIGDDLAAISFVWE